MTAKEIRLNKLHKYMKRENSKGSVTSFILLLASVSFSVFLSPSTAKYVKEGLSVCAVKVIPAVFPFFIISDLYVNFGHPERLTLPAYLFEKLFRIERAGIAAYVVGALCGFPLGVKAAAELYRGGVISKESAERLSAISNLPSPAFIISAVGAASFGNKNIGILLFISVLFSSVLCGVIFRQSATNIANMTYNSKQSFSLVESVRSAGVGVINVCAFVTAFSVIVGLARDYLPFSPLRYVVISLLEVSMATESFARLSPSGLTLSLFGTAFSLGFGGLSVMLQGVSLTAGCGFKTRKYIFIKIIQGLISGALSIVFYLAFLNSGLL